MPIGTASAYDIPGTLVVGMLVAADTSSARVGIPATRTATTPPDRKNYHPFVLVYKVQHTNTWYSVKQYQVYAMMARG